MKEQTSGPAARIFVEEALSIDPVELDGIDAGAREWAVARAARSSGTLEAYHGAAGPQPPRAWSVSAIETYLTCPFKFFAQYVMRLDEERDDEEVMDPKQQGRFVHEVFEAFFSAWQSQGHRGITASNLDAARRLFAEVVEERLQNLPEAEGALERTRLLGRRWPPGLGGGVPNGGRAAGRGRRAPARVPAGRRVRVHLGPRDRAGLLGVADRPRPARRRDISIDRLHASSAPNKSRALQLPIYGLFRAAS